jgi:phosphopantothenate-cysteine ligase
MPNTTESNATTFSAESYFETQPEPPTLQGDIQGVSHFIDRQVENGRKVVLVTVNYPPLRQIHTLILQHD